MSTWYQKHRDLYPYNWRKIAEDIKDAVDWKCEACGVRHGPPPYVLTVHHIDFNPGNCAAENLIALCQRCHLKVQGMMNQPRTRAVQGRQLYFK